MNYNYHMEFEWDHEKSNRCYVARGFDFAYAAQGFSAKSKSEGGETI
jgi:uncharacterized DUF497 family protein